MYALPLRIISEFADNTNPSWLLYKTMEKDIQDTRSTLFDELESVSPLVASVGKKILDHKIESANSPLMGELFPWIIQDITNIEKDTIKSIAVGWLAIYIYTIFLDRHLDSGGKISPEEFLTSSILAKKGLLCLYKNVINTRFEKAFNESLNLSAVGQLQDAIETKHASNGNIEEIAVKKNNLLIACANAIAAHNNIYSDAILDFANSFLPILQYLDDLGDWEEDLNERHINTLLAKSTYCSEDNLTIFDLDHNLILENMTRTGTLRVFVVRIQELLEILLGKLSPVIPTFNETPSFSFIEQLDRKLELFQDHLVLIEGMINELPIRERQPLLIGIKRNIQIIAQSS